MKESVLSLVMKCHVCGDSYIPEIGEICSCPEEPVVSDWEDVKPPIDVKDDE